jgi:hypothetical protein
MSETTHCPVLRKAGVFLYVITGSLQEAHRMRVPRQGSRLTTLLDVGMA